MDRIIRWNFVYRIPTRQAYVVVRRSPTGQAHSKKQNICPESLRGRRQLGSREEPQTLIYDWRAKTHTREQMSKPTLAVIEITFRMKFCLTMFLILISIEFLQKLGHLEHARPSTGPGLAAVVGYAGYMFWGNFSTIWV